MKSKRTDASGKAVKFGGGGSASAGKFKKKGKKGRANDDVFGVGALALLALTRLSQKKKVKLGRTVAKSNSTNTSFKASSISVPAQSVCEVTFFSAPRTNFPHFWIRPTTNRTRMERQ